ncbi:MAG: glycosyltransferase [Planctomycetota bacterium]|nr:glycosyltransferase [Planctomycetota bacterium]MDA1178223.1 glycosyltransferase [Planctomycetota bacterium]
MSELRFSVVVPTYQRPENLARCVDGIARLNYPAEAFELVIVDDGSPLAQEETIARAAGDRLRWRYVRQGNAGPGVARNTGVEHAVGQFIAFTDDDCVPAPDWLSVMDRHLRQNADALVGGQIVNALPHWPCSQASQQLVAFLYEYFDGRPGRPRMFCSNNMAMSRSRFRELGGFNASFRRAAGEDRELSDRWHHHGFTLIYTPDAIVHHWHAMNFRQFWRQHFTYGRGAHQFHQMRAADKRGVISPEPLSFYRRLMTYPLRESWGPRGWRQTVLLGVAQVANALGYLAERYHEGKPASKSRPAPTPLKGSEDGT